MMDAGRSRTRAVADGQGAAAAGWGLGEKAAELLIALAVAGCGVVIAYGSFAGWLAMQHFPGFYGVMGIDEPDVGHGRLFWRGVLGCALVMGGVGWIAGVVYVSRGHRGRRRSA